MKMKALAAAAALMIGATGFYSNSAMACRGWECISLEVEFVDIGGPIHYITFENGYQAIFPTTGDYCQDSALASLEAYPEMTDAFMDLFLAENGYLTLNLKITKPEGDQETLTCEY